MPATAETVEAALVDDVIDCLPAAGSVYADWLEDAGRGEDAGVFRAPPAARVDALSPAQQRLLPVWRDAWLKVGLAADPALDRAEVEALVGDAYRAGGLEPPGVFVHLESPLRGAIGAHVLSSGEVYSQVGSQVYSQVGSQVGSQVDSQVYSQVYSQVGSQVRSQVYSQVGSQVDSQVYSQVYSQVGSQVDSQVYSQVGSQVDSQVYSQVYSQVGSQVYSQVYSQVGSQVYSQVGSQVDSQVYSQVYSQVGSQVWKACCGAHDSGWLSFYSYLLAVGRLPCCERLAPLMRLARRVGWWWPFRGVCVVTPRPSLLVMRRKRLVEVQYPDGWGFKARG